MKSIKTLTLVAVMVVLSQFTISCAHRYREGSTGRTSDQVKSALEGILNNGTSTVSADVAAACGTTGIDSPYFSTVMNDPSKLVYYSENTPSMGPLSVVMPLDFSEITNGDVTSGTIQSVSAYFLTRKNGGSFDGILIFQYSKAGESQVCHLSYFINDGSGTLPLGEINSGDFKMVLTNPVTQKSITVYSDDLNSSSDDLGLNIKLSIYDDTRQLGQVSTFEGM